MRTIKYMTSGAQIPPSSFPGERLGLPRQGPRSVARFGVRIVALFVDWFIALFLTLLLFGIFELSQVQSTQDLIEWYLSQAQTEDVQLGTFGMFLFLQILAILTIGGSIGHRLMGIYVVRINGETMVWWRAIVRTLLLGLIIPVLVWDSDQRGFHDKIAGTILLRSR
jgi:uncharacterized RDD family membrane protein YckC